MATIISVDAEMTAAVQGLNAFSRRQVPYAAAAAINDVAFQVLRAERANIGRTFKSPRPFTQNSVQVDKANKTAPEATVFVRPEVAKYLDPYEFGGLHVTPGKALLDPKAQPVDAYGQLRKGTAKRLAGRNDVFVARVHGHWGFWRRNTRRQIKMGANQLTLLIAFGRNQPVKLHLDFEQRGLALVRKAMPAAMLKALTKSLASAR